MKRILLVLTISLFTQLIMAQNKRALLVGISDYQCVNKYGGWNNIHGKNDVDLLYPTLKRNGIIVSCISDKDATKAGIIVMHNHPSGDPTPSNQDIEITNSLIYTGNLMGIKLIDHIIFGNNRFYSFYENMNKNK